MSEGLQKPIEPLAEVVRIADVEFNQYFHPAPEHRCPCGSGRQSRECHLGEGQRWVATRPPPLLTGPRTRYANPGCYARRSNDCDDKLTREHFITDDVLEAISHDGKVIIVEGASWQDKTERSKTIGRQGLSTRMLCHRHNSALWPLDKMAAEFFRCLVADQLDIFKYLGNDRRSEFSRGFVMASGPFFELWLLKVIWGAIESGMMEIHGLPAYRFRLGVTTEQLAEILWRGADWPPTWGMYMLLDRDNDQPIVTKSARLRLANMSSEILGGYVQIAGIEFLISFETPPVRRLYRPHGLYFMRKGFPVTSWKSIVFAWPDLDHLDTLMVSAAPPSEDFTVPPNPRAASFHHGIAEGSLNVRSVPQPPIIATDNTT
ncbi:hypothetical protein HZU40_20205 [Mycolicibacterium fluoranthenivorans]|uniref:Uncharacterized protein n=1 Tax=Mycolicibacterium fluoranthenivorans TaxID=258505 RepID=A0A7G8P8B5_9MYCO|nr:hypothetical protein [Mycolicibacterium fluoranthenivorans]QNJ90581.1 hypothetical protein HZU40_20205 [Mycolicibacterium fluoranthenivorans]